MVGMANERTAPTALRRAETLHGRLGTVADPPAHLLVMSASYTARGNRAAEAQELAERALACEPYPPPMEICNVLIFVLTLVECYDTLQRLCEDLLAAARRRGAMQELVGISLFRASAWCDCGALADAEADARWALERADGVHRIHAVSEVIRVLDRARRARRGRARAGAMCRSACLALDSRGSVSDRAGPAACRPGPPAGGA